MRVADQTTWVTNIAAPVRARRLMRPTGVKLLISLHRPACRHCCPVHQHRCVRRCTIREQPQREGLYVPDAEVTTASHTCDSWKETHLAHGERGHITGRLPTSDPCPPLQAAGGASPLMVLFQVTVLQFQSNQLTPAIPLWPSSVSCFSLSKPFAI